MLTEIAVIFAEKWHTSPFDVLEKDIDDFILIANILINKQTATKSEKTKNPKKEERIRVNDATATGGWF